jgi:hypothetical protein
MISVKVTQLEDTGLVGGSELAFGAKLPLFLIIIWVNLPTIMRLDVLP